MRAFLSIVLLLVFAGWSQAGLFLRARGGCRGVQTAACQGRSAACSGTQVAACHGFVTVHATSAVISPHGFVTRREARRQVRTSCSGAPACSGVAVITVRSDPSQQRPGEPIQPPRAKVPDPKK